MSWAGVIIGGIGIPLVGAWLSGDLPVKGEPKEVTSEKVRRIASYSLVTVAGLALMAMAAPRPAEAAQVSVLRRVAVPPEYI
ncbi:MAG: hypothetical protein DRP12_00105 [Candidatus Aenigmatarchaeota archaeon]|nr:MAG: hypothetical protein DRP12_00105 [Candidatus Aenigmarchaeota archaeon]